MFTCRACTRRCLQALIGDLPVRTTHSQLIIPQRQLYSSFASNATDSEGYNYQPITQYEDHSEQPTKSRTAKRQEWLDSRGERPVDKQPAPIDPRIDDKFIWKLKQLQDPLRLADYVRKLLSDDDFEKALLYVRSASKNVECVVSWNHLIEWQFSKGQLSPALKTYNEVCYIRQILWNYVDHLIADEKTSTVSRCANLHHHIQRLQRKPIYQTSFREGISNIYLNALS